MKYHFNMTDNVIHINMNPPKPSKLMHCCRCGAVATRYSNKKTSHDYFLYQEYIEDDALDEMPDNKRVYFFCENCYAERPA